MTSRRHVAVAVLVLVAAAPAVGQTQESRPRAMLPAAREHFRVGAAF